MNYKFFAEKIIALRDADLQLRDKLVQQGQLGEGYNLEMEELHTSNAKLLDGIIDNIGYPTINIVGTEASEAAWLIIQHSISQPEFMKKCTGLLEKAVQENTADPLHLAFLTDRVAVLEGKQQLYGTQFDWDGNGEMSANPFDDISRVNERRKSVGLNTLEEQTIIMRFRAKNERHLPSADFKKREQEIEAWKQRTGWKK